MAYIFDTMAAVSFIVAIEPSGTMVSCAPEERSERTIDSSILLLYC